MEKNKKEQKKEQIVLKKEQKNKKQVSIFRLLEIRKATI